MCKKLFIVVLFFVTYFDVIPQSLSVHNFSTDNGLPQNSIYSIVQDDNNFLWIATEDGVSRFDGTEFKNFSKEDGLPYSHVRVIFQDSKKRIWFGTNEGVGVLEGDSNKIINLNETQNFPSDFVYSIVEGKDSSIFFATGDSGLYKYSINKLTKVNLPGLADSLRSLAVDSLGNLWIGTINKGLYKIEGNDFLHPRKVREIRENQILSLFVSFNNTIYVGTENGFYVIDKKKITRYDAKNQFEDIPVSSFIEDKNKRIWIGTVGKGVFEFDGGEFSVFTKDNGLSGNIVLAELEDRRGDLWFGYRDHGLDRLPVEKFLIYNRSNGLASNNVFGIFRDKRGRLWFGHLNSGVTLFYRNKAKILTAKDGILGNGAVAFVQPNRNDVLIGVRGGIARFNNSLNRIDSVFLFKDSLLQKSMVISFEKKNRDTLFVGTTNGLFTYSMSKHTFQQCDSISSIIGNSWVNSIFVDDKNQTVFSTDPAGVIITKHDSLIAHFTIEKGLASNTVFWGLQDKSGNYWFCTDAGISKYDGTLFTTYTVEDGLPVNVVYYGVEEGAKYIYFGTNKGIVRINYKELATLKKDAINIYTKKDGLAGTEMNQFSVFKDVRNNLYFGTHNGVTRFNPEDKPRKFPSNTYIRNIKIITEESEIDTLVQGTLDLKYFMNNISIEYRGIILSDPGKTLYKYRLMGIDKNWTETKENSITYRALPPGNYTFQVKCRNQDGIWSKKSANVNFVIYPPFWKTWWFQTLVVIFIIAMIWALFAYKTRQVKRKNLELARLVRERTKQLQKEKDKTDELIHNILPASAVEELKEKGFVKPRLFGSVTILFTDFKEFTKQAALLPPNELVEELNKIFLAFDNIVEEFGLEKLKTIGDSYMAASGLPQETDDHAERVIKAALKMQEFIKNKTNDYKINWVMRAGIHTGNVVAGVVGSKKFTYDIWGDTVNIASRMESSGVPGYVNISAATYEIVKDKFVCEYRGRIDAKGKGKMDMYLVLRPKEN